MAITDRTRKILWVKAGGRCSICRVQLVTEATEADDPSVFGEEAHIAAQSPTGPRAGNVTDIDAYDNLILLCRKHHKQVDDQISHFTIERLREIKQEHEVWIANLGATSKPGPVRIVPDPTRPPSKVLTVFTTGSALWRFFEGARAFYPSWPDGLSDEHDELITNFFDELRDWRDLEGDLHTFQDQRNAANALGDHIKHLAEAGYLVGARERLCLLTGGTDEDPWPWRVIDIQVHAVTEAQLVDSEGQPLGSEQST